MLNERKGDLLANKTNDMAHTKWLCKYHIVFTPKYRRKVIYNQYRKDLRDIIKTLCGYKGVEIIEGKLIPDHVHILVSIPPKYSISQFMGYLKGKSALMMFDRHANLKYKYGNRHFWAEGYYVSTVGLNEAAIKKYIQEQEKHDIALDKLSVKEYEPKLYPVSKCDDGDNVFHSVLLSKTLTPLTPFVTPSARFLSKVKPFFRRVCGCSDNGYRNHETACLR